MAALQKFFSAFIWASVWISVTGIGISNTAQAATSVYEISKDGQKIYLGGTIHLLRKNDFPLPQEFEQAYVRAHSLVLEIDMQLASAPEFGQQLAQSMQYTDGNKLQNELTPAVWRELQSYTTTRKIPLDVLNGYKPFYVSMVLTLAEGERLKLGEGVDAYFNQKARATNKPVSALESTADALAYMRALDHTEPNKTITATLHDLANMERVMAGLVRDWRMGKLEKIDRQMAAPLRAEAPDMYQALVVQRNQKWLPRIEAMFASPDIELVLVGSLHLTGADGLLQQLKNKGYTVKPYRLQR